MANSMNWFVLKQTKLWGDYGDVLINGYYRRDGDGHMQLHRAGPFLPPLSMPWSSVGGPAIIVSDDFRQALIRAGFNELKFKSVTKSRIIRLNWHEWDLTADSPPEYPDGGEPEHYIWEQPHDELAATEMQVAWELMIPVSSVRYEGTEPDGDGPQLTIMEDREYPRWFRTRTEWGDVVVSSTVRDWVESQVGKWVRHEPLTYKIA